MALGIYGVNAHFLPRLILRDSSCYATYPVLGRVACHVVRRSYHTRKRRDVGDAAPLLASVAERRRYWRSFSHLSQCLAYNKESSADIYGVDLMKV